MSEVKSVNIRDLVDSYEFPCTLVGSGQQLTIKPITTMQLKKLLTYEDEQDNSIIEEALDGLISSSVLTEGFDINNLYLQDRFKLLLDVRRASKGNAYTFAYKCPECGIETIASVDLSSLSVTPFDVGSRIVNISDKMQFELDFPTRGDQKVATSVISKHLTGKEKQLEIAIATYAKSVKKVIVGGEEIPDVPLEDIIYVLENVSTKVFDNFKQWYSDNNFGVEFNATVSCIHGHESEVHIPLDNFFV